MGKHAFVSLTIRPLLAAGSLEIVGEARDGEAVVALAAAEQPDVILMDLAHARCQWD
jgi:DNA-binding NarL/FixJ family response regulator